MTKRSLLVGLFVSLAISSAVPAAAQPASLVKDIRTGTLPAEWSGTEYVELGGFAYFRGEDRIHGGELWRSDGTAMGTTLVRDICPGVCSSVPSELTVMGSAIYFRADDGVHGPSLWKTDGTRTGTLLVKAVEPSRLAVFGSLLAFAAASPSQGQELWRSDGTAAGTLPLGDLRPGSEGSSPQPIGDLAGVLLFHADDGTHGRELWKTDGTEAGTVLLKDLNPGSGPGFLAGYPEPSAVAGGRLLFRAYPNYPTQELWASDGTADGTVRLGTVVPNLTSISGFATLGGTVFFGGQDGLWKSDGTGAGTVRVKETPGAPLELTAAGDRLYFWIADFGPSSSFWSSDGTEAGTVQVPLPSGVSLAYSYHSFLALGDLLIFYGFRSDTGLEPWATDGTTAGTVLLGDIHPGADTSSPPHSNLSGVQERGVAVGYYQ